MKILSVTFHVTESAMKSWEIFCHTELEVLLENLMDVDQYLFSEVENEMIQEGKNFNTILFFENEELAADFLEFELPHIVEKIAIQFGENVMIFPTLLHPIFQRFS